MSQRIIKSGNKRFQIYIFGVTIAAAMALATLVTVGIISKDDIEAWMLLVVGMVGAIVQFVTNILAALNTDRGADPGAHADQ